jgi:hypothetical protein
LAGLEASLAGSKFRTFPESPGTQIRTCEKFPQTATASLFAFDWRSPPDHGAGCEQQASRNDQRLVQARHERAGLANERAEQRDPKHATGLPGRALSMPAAMPERDLSTLPSSVEVSGGTSNPRPVLIAISCKQIAQ